MLENYQKSKSKHPGNCCLLKNKVLIEWLLFLQEIHVAPRGCSSNLVIFVKNFGVYVWSGWVIGSVLMDFAFGSRENILWPWLIFMINIVERR